MQLPERLWLELVQLDLQLSLRACRHKRVPGDDVEHALEQVRDSLQEREADERLKRLLM